MSKHLFISGAVGLTVVNLLVGGVVLWAACRLCRCRRVSYRRALGVWVLIALACFALVVADFMVADEGRMAWIRLVLLLGGAVGYFGLLKGLLRVTTGKAFLVGLLALVFNAGLNYAGAIAIRTGVCEAFVVPTGGMAPAICGLHHDVVCRTCGTSYMVGSYGPARRGGSSMPSHCPNCGTVARIPDRPVVLDGDRLLADKTATADRWDIVVFKDPRDGATDFVQRVVGLPGEVIEIIDGDVYTVSVAELQDREPGLLDRFDRLREAVHALRHEPDETGKIDLLEQYARLNLDLLPLLTIERKPRHVQESLWIGVYDHDHFDPTEQRLVGWKPLEVDGVIPDSWDTARSEMVFDSAAEELHYIEFVGTTIDDASAYNGDGVTGRPTGLRRSTVGDVRLRLTWMPESPAGKLVLEMNRHRNRFIASLGVDGSARLERLDVAANVAQPGAIELGQVSLSAFPAGMPVSIEFANVDYRVSLRVAGKEVLATTDESYAPGSMHLAAFCEAVALGRGEPDFLKPSVIRIGARKMRCRLRHVVLDRDVCYRSMRQLEAMGSRAVAGSRMPDRDRPNPYLRWPGWGTAGMPMLLRHGRTTNGTAHPAEYFTLGDNSPSSKDSRLWWEIGPQLEPLGEEYQVGTVPEDHLVGVARCIYWPPSRWRWFE